MTKTFTAVSAVAVIAAAALVQPSIFTDAKEYVVTVAQENGLVEQVPTVTPDPAPAPAATAAPAQNAPATSSATSTHAPEPQAPAVPTPGSLGSKNGHDHYSLTKPENSAQAAWSSCAPVPVVINPANAPKGAVNDMKVALDQMKSATGLDIQYLGTTDAATKEAWGYSSQPGFDGWPPVLVSWARPGEPGTQGLDGTAAFAEPFWRTNADGVDVMVSGRIVFNRDEDGIYTPGFGSEGSRVALQMHELGHTLGLAHVDDEEQLMNPIIYARDLGAGDLAGLKKLSGNCLTAPPAP